jgi:hypothetical protein
VGKREQDVRNLGMEKNLKKVLIDVSYCRTKEGTEKTRIANGCVFFKQTTGCLEGGP